MKIILEQSLYLTCQECGKFREHTVEVHSSIHFSSRAPWTDEFFDFAEWVKASDEDFFNFHEAYLLYLNRAS